MGIKAYIYLLLMIAWSFARNFMPKDTHAFIVGFMLVFTLFFQTLCFVRVIQIINIKP